MIRAATRDDLPAIEELARELAGHQSPWRVFPPDPGLVDTVVNRYRRFLASGAALVLVAEHGGEVVGMACAEVLAPSRFSSEEAVELSGVVVRDGLRGQGLGGELVRAAARFGRERGVRRLVVDTFSGNAEGMEFWLGLGFEPRVTQLTAEVDRLGTDGARPF